MLGQPGRDRCAGGSVCEKALKTILNKNSGAQRKILPTEDNKQPQYCSCIRMLQAEEGAWGRAEGTHGRLMWPEIKIELP